MCPKPWPADGESIDRLVRVSCYGAPVRSSSMRLRTRRLSNGSSPSAVAVRVLRVSNNDSEVSSALRFEALTSPSPVRSSVQGVSPRRRQARPRPWLSRDGAGPESCSGSGSDTNNCLAGEVLAAPNETVTGRAPLGCSLRRSRKTTRRGPSHPFSPWCEPSRFSYAKALLAATRQADLLKSEEPKGIAGMTPEQMARMGARWRRYNAI
jgi:hypothetical protein